MFRVRGFTLILVTFRINAESSGQLPNQLAICILQTRVIARVLSHKHAITHTHTHTHKHTHTHTH